ncbi:holin [Paenibacillus sp. JNUCC32]|uniref:holin n=1 Tax=Paenibacillus sp. JNUCC32 TaxID=2777984 RepID=UPI001787FA8B|nr:holin [Paenibacillus sp. JNUCC-32]QOT12945.1 holin [Paenibacillus sp. JNUCC-32]
MKNEVLTSVLTFATTLAVIVLALVQFVKKTINMPSNVVPWIGLGIGVLVGAAAYPFTDLDLTLRLWAGGFAGLSATGFFELVFSDRKGTTK